MNKKISKFFCARHSAKTVLYKDSVCIGYKCKYSKVVWQRDFHINWIIAWRNIWPLATHRAPIAYSDPTALHLTSRWLRLLSVLTCLRRWFCCCWLNVCCYFYCLGSGIVFGPFLLCSTRCPFWVSNHLAEEERAGWFLAVIWLLVFWVSSSRCCGLNVICSVWLW